MAGKIFDTRGRLAASCLLTLKGTNQAYEPAECGSIGKGVEYIAQSRAIARLNQMQNVVSKSGINANIQWEVVLPSGKHPDILVYNRDDPSVPLQVIEVKGTWSRYYNQTQRQITGYIQELQTVVGPAYTVVPGTVLNGTVDSFRGPSRDLRCNWFRCVCHVLRLHQQCSWNA
ncbi:hypothetical protein [Arthrobacter sp. M4]|uniref:hypothetical protein n=1 Tax=Arthrobacter sp. M4 TaxID=218160 RepID=UPI001CDB6E6D|nr:hypothetical protein [Arthrobacter sp. M4]MCA4135710.1 hypothetical protein [Arthrobacter sp. M4]